MNLDKPVSECVVLVPTGNRVYWPCESALRELEARGYEVRRVPGYSAIDQARNQIATDALRDGFEEHLWIDSDVGFHPDDVETLRNHRLPLVCGLYPKKGSRALACHLMPETESITFGKGGAVFEIKYAGAGFLLVQRQVYETIQRQLKLPTCNQTFEKPTIPFFQPMVVGRREEAWYLAEDYSFSERARRCGFSVMADSTIRLMHCGDYGYSWEDAGSDVDRFRTYHYHVDRHDVRL